MTGVGTGAGPAPTAPAVVGRYRLLRELGSGGMGVVHLGMDADDRVAAVKVLRPHVAVDPEARARLAREAAALRRLRHPRVAEIVDVDLTEPHPYVAMRYIPGPPLEQVVREQGALQGPALAAVLWGLHEALSVIHAAGLVHRDIKPSNVLLLDGEPVVIDFGIARAADDVTVTMAGMVVGTPGYLAPEVLSGGEPRRSADWWGWAAVAGFAATGRTPFGRSPTELVLDRIRRGEADLDGLPASLDTLIRSGLHPDPARRPGPDEIREALAAAVGPPPGAAAATARLAAAPPAAPPPAARPAPVPAVTPGPGARPGPAGRPAPEPDGGPVVTPTARFPSTPGTVAEVRPGVSRPPVAATRTPAPQRSRPAPARQGGPPPPGHAPQGHAPQGHAPQGHAPQGHAPQGYAPQGHGQQGYAPQGYAPQGYRPPAPVPVGASPAAPVPPAAGRRWLEWAWLAAVLTAAVAAPTGVLVLGLVWTAVARSVEWTRIARAREAYTAASRMRPTGSMAGHVLMYPIRWVGALGLSMLYALPLVVGAALLVWARAALAAFDGVGLTTFAAVISALVIAATWWGAGGTTLRRGTRFVTAPITRHPNGKWIWLGVAGLVIVAGVLTIAGNGAGPDWNPDWTVPAWLEFLV